MQSLADPFDNDLFSWHGATNQSSLPAADESSGQNVVEFPWQSFPAQPNGALDVLAQAATLPAARSTAIDSQSGPSGWAFPSFNAFEPTCAPSLTGINGSYATDQGFWGHSQPMVWPGGEYPILLVVKVSKPLPAVSSGPTGSDPAAFGITSAPSPPTSLPCSSLGGRKRKSRPTQDDTTLHIRVDQLTSTVTELKDAINKMTSPAPIARPLHSDNDANDFACVARVLKVQQDIVPWIKDLEVVSRAVHGRAKPEDLYHLANPRTTFGNLAPPEECPTDSEAAASQFVNFFRSRPNDFESAWRTYGVCMAYAGRPESAVLLRSMSAHQENLRSLSWAYSRNTVLLYHYRVQERRRQDTETGLKAIGEVDQAVLGNLQPVFEYDRPRQESEADDESKEHLDMSAPPPKKRRAD